MAFQVPSIPDPNSGKKRSSTSQKPNRVQVPVPPKTAIMRSQLPPTNRKKVSTKTYDSSDDSSSDSSSDSSYPSSSKEDSNNYINKRKAMSRNSNPRDRKNNNKKKEFSSLPGYDSGNKFPGAIRTKPSEFQNQDQKPRNPLVPDTGALVKFNTDMRFTLGLNEHLGANYPLAMEVRPKVFINMANYRTAVNTAGTVANDWLKQAYYRVNRDVISKARNTSVTAAWTQTKWVTYNSDMINGLEAWYFLDSTRSIDASSTPGFRDKNATFMAYQQLFDDPVITKAMNTLQQTLNSMWCPPNLQKLIKATFQKYRVSPLEQAPLFMFASHAPFVYDGTKPFSASDVATMLDNASVSLKTADNANISSLLSTTYNSGIINSLGPSSKQTIYDPNFLEVFANQPMRLTNDLASNANHVFPFTVSGQITDIPYMINRKPEECDGFAYALHPTAIGTTVASSTLGVFTSWKTAFFVPTVPTGLGAANMTSRYTLTADAATCVSRNSFTQNSSSPDAIQLQNQTTSYYPHCCPPDGWQRVYTNNVDGPRVNLEALMDYLWGFEIQTLG